jgi:4-amino-4-deoxy-L-arabinose transferase-like glycosyltransferase
MLATLLLTLVALGIGGLVWWQLYRRHRYSDGKRPALFPVVLAVGVFCRLAYTFLTPVFYAPDEQSHFHYIQFIAEHGDLPVLTTKMGDPVNEWEYSQPPLYYLAMAPFFRFADSVGHHQTATVLLLRCFSFLLWLLNVWLGVTLLNRLRITDQVVRIFFLALLCLLPTYTFCSSAINNDNLLVTIGGGLLCLFSRRDYSVPTALQTALLLGLAFLTKQSAVVFVPLVITLVGLECVNRRVSWRSGLLYLGLTLGGAFLLYLPWLVRNWQIYHTLTPEFLTTPQVRWPSLVYGIASAAHNLVKSFWAVSGISNDIGYPFPLVGMLFLAGCLGAGQIDLQRKRRFDPLHVAVNRPLLVAFGMGLVVNLLLVLRFGYLFGMGQGRHLFPLLFPIALTLGSWLRPIAVKKLDVHTAGALILYALTFTAYSLARFPR